MRWEHPWALLLLLVIPLLFAWRMRRPDVRPAAVLWVRKGPLAAGWVATLVRALEAMPWLALVIAVFAIARPQQGLRQSETETRGVDIMMVIDISPSMAAEDFQPANRLVVAKQTAREFVRERPHDRLGLVAFAATAFNQCPLTLDHEALIELIDQLEIGLAEDGTAIGMGLATAVAGLKESKTPSKVVVLLTDGANNRGAIDPLTGADLARAFGIKVYTVLVGRGGLVPVPIPDPVMGRRTAMVEMDIDEPTMKEIARRTGGSYYRATEASSLAGIYADIDRLERAPIRSIEYREYEDLGPRLMIVAAMLLGLFLLGSSTWAFRLP
jgi:Ca-activated chloride channel family protein